MQLSRIEHLSKEDIIKNGSVFTPEKIVDMAREWLKPILLKSDYIIDFGVGYGAFISKFLDLSSNCIATDIDKQSISLINEYFPSVRTYVENSLVKISREKYNVPTSSRLIIIGNPPYNDLTSQFKKGEKGLAVMDNEVKSRDLGLSFLKMYCMLDAEYICILHPLSYLIKKTNFKSLDFFTRWYSLQNAMIFSSKEFETIQKTYAEFPVVLALYRKTWGGMPYSFVENFKFSILGSKNTFSISDFTTIDGHVNKYPNKSKKETDMQFYTLRDINALRRNKTFVEGNPTNGLTVSLEDLYKYAWLDFFKKTYSPQNYFIYGNLSPLYSSELEDKNVKKALISYIYNNNKVVYNYINQNNLLEKLKSLYDFDENNQNWEVLNTIISKFNT